MLKLRLQYFGHLMQRADPLETLNSVLQTRVLSAKQLGLLLQLRTEVETLDPGLQFKMAAESRP